MVRLLCVGYTIREAEYVDSFTRFTVRIGEDTGSDPLVRSFAPLKRVPRFLPVPRQLAGNFDVRFRLILACQPVRHDSAIRCGRTRRNLAEKRQTLKKSPVISRFTGLST